MSFFANFQILGTLGRDPELSYNRQNNPMTSFPVVVERKWYGKDGNACKRNNWLTCKAYDKTARNICKYLGKGCKATFTGEIRQEQWKDENGNPQQRVFFVVLEVYFLTTKNSSGKTPSEDLEEDLCLQHPDRESTDSEAY